MSARRGMEDRALVSLDRGGCTDHGNCAYGVVLCVRPVSGSGVLRMVQLNEL